MAIYIDLDKAIEDVESVGAYYSEEETVKELCLMELKGQPIADVVPRSEVDKADQEIERLEHILNNYALQYGTVTDKQKVIDQAKQDVAREIFEKIWKRLAMYSHIHKYAEEAKHSTEEYADGTPCEMTSVWEVLSLHKNGWDDYETMCKLQDNIGNIEKSRLLKEVESDLAELKKKYIGE